MCSLDVLNSTSRANVGLRSLLVSLDIDAILAETTIHKMSTPIVLINPAGYRSRGLREVIRELQGYYWGRKISARTLRTFRSNPALMGCRESLRGNSEVKLLLGRDISTNNSSRSCRTPLTLATANRHFRIVELLYA